MALLQSLIDQHCRDISIHWHITIVYSTLTSIWHKSKRRQPSPQKERSCLKKKLSSIPMTRTRSHLETSCFMALKNGSGNSSPKKVMSGFNMPPQDGDRQYTTLPKAISFFNSSNFDLRLQSMQRNCIYSCKEDNVWTNNQDDEKPRTDERKCSRCC